MKHLSNFEGLWNNYPDFGKGGDDNASQAGALQTKAQIGGAANGSWITDTCTLRLSRALNYSGQPVPHGFSGMRTVLGADGKYYAYAVREMEGYLRSTYGPPIIKSATKKGQLGVSTASFLAARGIIGFDLLGYFRSEGYRGGATGHLDLWNGSSCRYEDYFNAADKVYFWPVVSSAKAHK
jgi:hypothetical protein